ncbi:tetratricopeptide repeat protein [Streptomyces sp. NPDC127103]|uniref:tetratricopeptide repeat protein n=1 Tax=Streptomyces sp. NPDC127103 TaxID=3347139 RepID=UPI0036541B7C
MGAKKKSGKRKSGGMKERRPGQGQQVGSSFAGASFTRSQVLGSGTQTTKINVQAYAAVPTAWNALPGLPQEFTGRADEIAKILSLLDPESGEGAAIGSVAGLPGVGKTTLAHAVGHAALDKGWFTGVQLVNLRGYDPNPVPPQDALEALLRALGVGADHIPPTLDERAGLYRSQLDAMARDGERFLILADNASTSEQIRPLLPARHHAVLVTSRHTLPGLGARLVNLHPLQPDAAVDLLRQRLEVVDPDDRRVEDEPAAAEELAALCGYLPLALQIAAALLADDPDQPLSERVRMLTDAGSRLGGFDDGERNLRAVFDECLTRLTHQQADLYRLLGLHPGPDISTPAVAALANQPADRITLLLRQLVQARLLTQNSQTRDRWSMHDLLRVHAQEQARIIMDAGRATRRRFEQARMRLTEHYLRHAEAADTYLRPPGEPLTLFTSMEHALAWFDAERENLLATAYADLSAHTETARFGFALGRYLEWRRRLQDLLTVREHALDACQVLGDTRNLPGAWINLGGVLVELGRHDEALEAHETALRLHQQTGNIHGQAAAWNNLGSTHGKLRRFDEALEAHQIALRLHEETGNVHGQAMAWNNLGSARGQLGRHDEALEAHQIALRLHEETGNVHGQAVVWDNVGTPLGELGRFDEALEAHQNAFRLHQQTGNTHGEANAWDNVGRALGDLKRYDKALEAHNTALRLHQETSDFRSEANVWDNVGKALGELGRYVEALEAYETGLHLSQQTDNVRREANTYNNIGNVLQKLHRYDGALEAHETSLRLHQQTGEPLGQGVAWNNIGTACRALGRHTEAIAAAKKAVAMLTQEADWALVGEAWGELATTLSTSGDKQSRIREAWEQSATAYTHSGDHEAAAASRVNAESCTT